MKKVYATAPLKDLVVKRIVPTGEESDEELREFAKEMLNTVHHPVGTCAMLPKELGGVVDSKLLVYGTANLRVVSVRCYLEPCEFFTDYCVSRLDRYLGHSVGEFSVVGVLWIGWLTTFTANFIERADIGVRHCGKGATFSPGPSTIINCFPHSGSGHHQRRCVTIVVTRKPRIKSGIALVQYD